MLTTLVQTVEFVKDVICYVLFLSWKTGKIIISCSKYITSVTTTVLQQLLNLLQVLSEDFSFFLWDVCHQIRLIVNGFYMVIDSILYTVQLLCETANFFIRSIFLAVNQFFCGISTGVETVIGAIIQTFVFLKRTLILFGSGIWFLVTLIPLSMVYGFTCSTYYVGLLLNEVRTITGSMVSAFYLTLQNMYKFATDVPLESAIGLLVGMCIIYILIQFHVLLYRFAHQRTLSFIEHVRRNMQNLQFRFLRPNGPILEELSEQESSEDSDTRENDLEDKYCVICQDHQKSVLLLPCRHVCLCAACNTRLKNYNRTCPICRTVVERTMKIFI